jgi:hypothetical protein
MSRLSTNPKKVTAFERPKLETPQPDKLGHTFNSTEEARAALRNSRLSTISKAPKITIVEEINPVEDVAVASSIGAIVEPDPDSSSKSADSQTSTQDAEAQGSNGATVSTAPAVETTEEVKQPAQEPALQADNSLSSITQSTSSNNKQQNQNQNNRRR